jgi:putative phosphoesterase
VISVRLAVLSDVHGNLPALEAVLSDVKKADVDLIVFGGDLASGPMPAETIDLVMSMANARFVRGNADRGIVAAYDGKPKPEWPGSYADWCATRISRTHRDFLSSFAPTVEVEEVEAVGRVLVCHGSPRSDLDVIWSGTPTHRLRAFLTGLDADLVVCGHTHIQFDRVVDDIRIVNAGSVGMPSGKPGAFWVQIGPGVQLKRTFYDRVDAAARLRKLEVLELDEFVRENVLRVPTLGEAVQFIKAAEAKQSAAAKSLPAAPAPRLSDL